MLMRSRPGICHRGHYFITPLIMLGLCLLSPALPADNQRPLLTPDLAQGVLLIAGENLQDPNFEKAVILITAYNEYATSGLVLNRRTKIPGPQVMPRLWQLIPLLDYLYIGGPVRSSNITLLLKSVTPVGSAAPVAPGIYLIDTFEQFNNVPLDGLEPENLRLYSGYAGWASGQLESELVRGDWHLWHASPETVFSPTPESLWDELIRVVSAKWVSR